MLIKTVQIVISNCGPSPSRLQALPTQRLVVQSTAPGVKAGQVSLTVHGTQQVHSPPEVGGGLSATLPTSFSPGWPCTPIVYLELPPPS